MDSVVELLRAVSRALKLVHTYSGVKSIRAASGVEEEGGSMDRVSA
jgi:hypothetical protein